MAGNIKGIIVQIGGDTSGLQNALKKVNSATASLSKELRGINSMLKLDPKNTDLLAQKQTVLRDKIEQTKQKINELKEAQSRYIESGGDLNSSEYRNLQREIIKTENELKQLNLETSKWNQASIKLGELSGKMKALGDTVTNVGKKVSVLSAAVAGLFTAGVKYNADIEKYTTAFKTFLGSAEEAEKAVNAIKKESATSPFDTSELIQANQMLITTGESADNSRKTISALSDAIALTGGSNDTLGRMASNLQQIKNVGKASAMDIRQFGMAGIDIYGILADYTGKTTAEVKKMDITYDQLSKALQKSASEGGKYYGGQAEMANTLSGQVSKLKKSFQDLLGELSQSLMPIIKSFANKLQSLVDWFKSLDDSQKNMITKIGLAIVALGPALVIIGKLISFGGTILGALSKISSLVAGLTTGTSALSGVLSALAGPVGIVIAVIGALVAAFVHIYKTNEDFRNKVQDTWNNIKNLFETSIKPMLMNLWDLVKTIVQSITDVIKGIWEFLEPYLTELFSWLLDFWNNYGSEIFKNISDFINNIITIIKTIIEALKPVISFLVEYFKPAFTAVFSVIKNVIKTAGDFIGGIIKSITGVFSGIIEFLTGVFTGNWKKAWEGIKKIFSNIVSGLGGIIKAPINAIIGIINGFIDGINKVQVPDWVPGVGGKGINIPHIPQLAKGGIIDKATLAMVGEGKSAEAVIPLDRTLTKYMAEAMKEAGGTRPITVNFYPQKMTDAEMDNAFNYINRRFGLAY